LLTPPTSASAPTPFALALYLFSDSSAQQERVLQAPLAGGVSVNETLMHIAQDGLPFGGVGPSGVGHYHGRFGFETMSNLKPVFRQSRNNGMGFSRRRTVLFSRASLSSCWERRSLSPKQYLSMIPLIESPKSRR